MKQIDTQLEIIEKSIEWVGGASSMQDAKGEDFRKKLVDLRIELNRNKFALDGKPAAAIFGGSQVGKSYLIKSLLTEKGKPFIIKANDTPYNFIADINPPGGKESTALVSRFSINNRTVNQEFPIKAILLSPTDIVLILCDSFYKDIIPIHELTLKPKDINEKIDKLKLRLLDEQKLPYYIKDDDVRRMEIYFRDYLSHASDVLSSSFFVEIPHLISKVKPSEWKDVFSLLWSENEIFTTLFDNLITEYKKLNFCDIVYLPWKSVLTKYGTLLDVKRFKELYKEEPENPEPCYEKNTTVSYSANARPIIFKKSYLCALAAELVFDLPEELLDTKKFLEKIDLLDFPGARSRLDYLQQDKITTETVHDLLLRGKVAYLFNKYSDAKKINIMLLCFKPGNIEARGMPKILESWVNKIVGINPEKRNEIIQEYKISPLFLIGTFFNVDLQYNPILDKKVDGTPFKQSRWEARFGPLISEILATKTCDWFENWTAKNSPFKNIFLLRDFEKSETLSYLFKGYMQDGKEEDIDPPPYAEKYPDFKEKLRESFFDYPFVQKYVEDYKVKYDQAANKDKDGSLLIIDKLTYAANYIIPAREAKIKGELKEITAKILKLLKDNHNSGDKVEELERAIKTAGIIQAQLGIVFGENRYFIGPVMKELMLPQTEVYRLYLKKLNDFQRRDTVNIDKYIKYMGIIANVKMPFSQNLEDFDVNLGYLRDSYEMKTSSECKDFFEKKGIDLNELFYVYGNVERVKHYSQELADALEDYWFEQYMPENQQNLAKIFSKIELQELRDMLRRLFNKLKISKIIADRIRHYVTDHRNSDDVYEMIADISAEIINKFIRSVGREYYKKENIQELENARKYVKGELCWEHDDLKFEKNTREEVAELITDMENSDDLYNQNPHTIKVKRLPNYRSYIIWKDLLKAGFIAERCVPDRDDAVSNEKLGKIIEQCQTINY